MGSIRPRQGDRCLDRHFVTPRAMIAWQVSERSKERRPRIISATATRSTVNGAPGEIGSRNVRRSDLCWLALALSPSPLPHPRGAVPTTIRPACSNIRPSTTRQQAFAAVIGPRGKRKTRPASAPAAPVTITASGAIPGRNHADGNPMSSLPVAPRRRDAQAAASIAVRRRRLPDVLRPYRAGREYALRVDDGRSRSPQVGGETPLDERRLSSDSRRTRRDREGAFPPWVDLRDFGSSQRVHSQDDRGGVSVYGLEAPCSSCEWTHDQLPSAWHSRIASKRLWATAGSPQQT